MPRYKHIIWDWNGTILDDLRQNLTVTNLMLTRRGLPTLDSVESYHSLFGFPVIDFYKKMGYDFEKESFQDVAKEYYHEMDDLFPETDIFPDCEEVLYTFKHSGINQLIISQLEGKALEKQVALKGIDHFFTDILGTEDIYVKSKVDIARRWQSSTGALGSDTLFIGDTAHDFETACAIGCDCVFVARGHGSVACLEGTGCRVFGCLSEVRDFVMEK